jgi:hypothetical protein
MTSIAPTGAAGYASPLDRLQAELQSEVTSGAISSTDQGALSTALDDIDQSLRADRTNDGGQSSGPPSPDQIKSKINDLINGEVQNGTLTSAQATELQNVFANAFAKGGPGGASGHHGHHHHGGDAADAGGSSASSSSAADTLLSAINSSSSDGAGATSDDATSLIQTFLQSLQNSQQQGAGYGANGDAAGSSSNALVIDFTS